MSKTVETVADIAIFRLNQLRAQANAGRVGCVGLRTISLPKTFRMTKELKQRCYIKPARRCLN